VSRFLHLAYWDNPVQFQLGVNLLVSQDTLVYIETAARILGRTLFVFSAQQQLLELNNQKQYMHDATFTVDSKGRRGIFFIWFLSGNLRNKIKSLRSKLYFNCI
jgi:hypothetical protein